MINHLLAFFSFCLVVLIIQSKATEATKAEALKKPPHGQNLLCTLRRHLQKIKRNRPLAVLLITRLPFPVLINNQPQSWKPGGIHTSLVRNSPLTTHLPITSYHDTSTTILIKKIYYRQPIDRGLITAHFLFAIIFLL